MMVTAMIEDGTNIAGTLASVLLFQGADLDDELDCVIALVGMEGRQYTPKQAALYLEEAVKIARQWPSDATGRPN